MPGALSPNGPKGRGRKAPVYSQTLYGRCRIPVSRVRRSARSQARLGSCGAVMNSLWPVRTITIMMWLCGWFPGEGNPSPSGSIVDQGIYPIQFVGAIGGDIGYDVLAQAPHYKQAAVVAWPFQVERGLLGAIGTFDHGPGRYVVPDHVTGYPVTRNTDDIADTFKAVDRLGNNRLFRHDRIVRLAVGGSGLPADEVTIADGAAGSMGR